MINREYLEDIKLLDNLLYEYMMDNHYYDIIPTVEPVSEGYIGKTPNLLKVENLLGKLHNQIGPYVGDRLNDPEVKFMLDKYDIKYHRTNQYDNPIIKEINALIKKEFGFKDFEFYLHQYSIANGYTFPDSFIFNDITQKKLWDFTKHGEKYYDHEHNMCVYVTSFLRNCRIFTPAEHLAIILHEIGHCFDRSLAARIAEVLFLFTDISNFTQFRLQDKLMFILMTLIGSRYGKLYGLLNQLVDKLYGPIFIISTFVNKIFYLFSTVKRYKDLADRFTHFASSPLYALGTQAMVGQEVFADSFATAYGYGPETAAVQVKFTQEYSLAIGNRYVDGAIYDVEFGLVLANLILDCHPDTLTRVSLNMKNLEKISNDPNLPPKYREQVAKDLKKSREIYEQYRDIEDSNKASIIRKIAYFASDKIFGGRMDLRTFIMGVSACDTPSHEVATDGEIRNFIDSLISGTYRKIGDLFDSTIIEKKLKPLYKPILSTRF